VKVLVFGAGAVGQHLAASLALHAQARVTLVARPRFCEAIASRGLTLEGRRAEVTAWPDLEPVDDDLFDYLVLTVKTYQVAAALDQILSSQLRFDRFVTLQNGLGTENLVTERLPGCAVLAATTTRAVASPAPGELVPEPRGGLAVAPVRPRSLPEAGIPSPWRELGAIWCLDYAAMKWSKLLLNMVCNASCALLDMLPAEVVSRQDLYRLEINAVREALRVMRAEGCRPLNLPDYPVRAFAQAAVLPTGLTRPLLGSKIAKARGDKPPSFLLEMRGGRGRTEVGALNGEIANRGRAHGVATPVNAFLAERLEAVCAGEIAWERYRTQPERLLEDLASHEQKTVDGRP